MKQWTRRQLLQQGGLASAGLIAFRASAQMRGMGMTPGMSAPKPTAKTLDAMKLQSFVDPLLLPVLERPVGRRSSAALGAENAAYYAIHVREIQSRLHRDLPPSRLFGYGSTSAPVLFEARSNDGVLIDWINDLPPKHFLPLDPPRPGMEDAPPTRISTHLHGARVPAVSDGYPDNWYGPGKRRLDFYPNHQDATALWCHDHAMGVSRFNVFAGLMGWYLVRDSFEQSLHLPSGQYELPLLLYDRSFTPQGQLYYPNPPDRRVVAGVSWRRDAGQRQGPAILPNRAAPLPPAYCQHRQLALLLARTLERAERSRDWRGVKACSPHRSRQRGSC